MNLFRELQQSILKYQKELEPDTDYIVYMNDMNVGDMKTNLSAKLSVSAELGKESVEIKVVRKQDNDYSKSCLKYIGI